MPALPVIRRIEQEHCTGCAVACVAMVAGIPYAKAVKVAFGKSVVRHGLELTFDDMARSLRKLGFSCRMGTDFRAKKLPAIMMFEWWSTGDHHCLVWDPAFGGRIVDPGYSRSLGNDFYWDHWKRSGREALVVTGRR